MDYVLSKSLGENDFFKELRVMFVISLVIIVEHFRKQSFCFGQYFQICLHQNVCPLPRSRVGKSHGNFPFSFAILSLVSLLAFVCFLPIFHSTKADSGIKMTGVSKT